MLRSGDMSMEIIAGKLTYESIKGSADGA